MADSLSNTLRVNRAAFRVCTFQEADREDRDFWRSQTPIARLRHMEQLRELNYGSEVINAGLQRVLAVSERARS